MAAHTKDTPEDLPTGESILTLDRVIIRPYDLTDIPALAKLANDRGIAKNMRNTFPYPHGLEHAESFIVNRASKTWPVITAEEAEDAATTTTTEEKKNDDGDENNATPAPAQHRRVLLEYALARRSDGAYMGGLGLRPKTDVEARTMELGYWAGREFRGRGYMTEAVRGLCAWAFATFPHLLRIDAVAHGDNDASAAVLRKAGFRAEGVRRRAVWKWGEPLDLLIFGMLRDECPPLSPSAGVSSSRPGEEEDVDADVSSAK